MKHHEALKSINLINDSFLVAVIFKHPTNQATTHYIRDKTPLYYFQNLCGKTCHSGVADVYGKFCQSYQG